MTLVPEMTYNVLSVMLNLYTTTTQLWQRDCVTHAATSREWVTLKLSFRLKGYHHVTIIQL